MTPRRAALLPALSLSLTALCLPPFGVWPLAFVQWLPLLWYCARIDAAAAGVIGALVGAACGSHVFFGATVLDPTSLMLSCAALAVGYGVFFAAASRLLSHSRRFAPLLLACLWVSIEWAYGQALLPFSMAITLTAAPATLQAAAIGGQPLVVFLLIAIQATLVGYALHPNDVLRLRIACATIVVAIALSLIGNLHRAPSSATLAVAAVQTDLHPYHYTFAEADGQLAYLAARRASLERSLTPDRPALSVWPEVVFGRYEWRAASSIAHAPVGASLFAGNDLDARGNKYNAVFGVDASGQVVSRHVKGTLLPRMESQYSVAQPPEAHHRLPGSPGSLICFESAFAGTALALVRNGAQVLTIATSDTYAGPAILSQLHAAFTVIRAVETRRSVVRAANGGPSMIVLPSGKVAQELGLFVPGVIRHEVPLSLTQTIYVRTADLWSIGFGLLALGALVLTFSVPPSEDVVALPIRWLRAGAALVVALCVLLLIQTASVARDYAQARGQPTAWPGLGFHTEVVDGPDYLGISADREEQSLAAAVAAAARRFGLDIGTGDVAARQDELGRRSIHRIAARELFESYDLGTIALPADSTRSVLPCVATLVDGYSVMIARRFESAAEIYEPSNGQYTMVEWDWLSSSFDATPVCVRGRAFGWDL